MSPAARRRITGYRPIKPLDPRKPLCPTSIPPLKASEFTAVEGQQAFDFTDDAEGGEE